ncbi:hypothetical protein [Trichococcus shcherbakoviae]|uniref:hypothetical protein n=1 Tax=Trichococcus shcherbakoviae TaxID=2094020 RepID=UPI002AA83410|nr:hypothetical protein [Trichococcus shcherbakoviae]
MTLSDLVSKKYLPVRVGISQVYAKNVLATTNRFSRFLGRPAKLADFTEFNVATYLTNYRQHWSARSTNNQRQILFSLWQEAADLAETSAKLRELPRPRRIKKLKEDTERPRCWRKGQMRKLVAYLKTLDGEICGIPASTWWLSLILSIHWTSSRISSMMAVQSADYDGLGLLVRKQKNHRPQWHRLPRSCRRLIEATNPNSREMLWPCPWCMRTLWDKFREIVEAVGLPSKKGRRKLFHKLRRGTITYCAKADPVVAQKVAGHKDFSTTLNSYIDETVVRQKSAIDVLYDPLKPPRPKRKPDRPASSNEHLLYESRKPAFRIFG